MRETHSEVNNPCVPVLPTAPALPNLLSMISIEVKDLADLILLNVSQTLKEMTIDQPVLRDQVMPEVITITMKSTMISMSK